MKTEEEKKKCHQGLLYDSGEPGLVAERCAAKELCHDYNALRPLQSKERQAIIRRLFGKVGENFSIEPPFWCDYGYNIRCGDNFYMNHGCVILDDTLVEFGDNVFVAPQCGFYCAGHPFDIEQRNACLEYARPIRVGSNVWIGGGVTVLPGVTIGDGCVIGAGSVVVHDIPPFSLAVGNPCRVIRSLKP